MMVVCWILFLLPPFKHVADFGGHHSKWRQLVFSWCECTDTTSESSMWTPKYCDVTFVRNQQRPIDISADGSYVLFLVKACFCRARTASGCHQLTWRILWRIYAKRFVISWCYHDFACVYAWLLLDIRESNCVTLALAPWQLLILWYHSYESNFLTQSSGMKGLLLPWIHCS